MKNKLILLATFVICLSLVMVSSYGISSSRTSSFQPAATFQTYYTPDQISTYWPILGNKETCGQRQDILLQVAPGGCQPAVVRSDLLAEQNVPVFCQIDALQVNPLLNIKEISNIRFTGNYPKEISGVGFHPARAALLTRDRLLGDPLINNIGYVVVVLKKNAVEKDLPNSVNVTLSGQIDYSSANSIGVGAVNYVLSPVSEEDWQTQKYYQSFWKGKFYVRLDNADANSAQVTLYNGDARIASTVVQRGKISEPIYMPGYYCQAGIRIAYDGFVDAKTSARIRVGTDGSYETFDAYQGMRFMNDKCVVNRIIKDSSSNTGSVDISCSGSNRITLQLKPFFNEKFNSLINEKGEIVIQDNQKIGNDNLYAVNLGTKGIYAISKNMDNSNLYYKGLATDSFTVTNLDSDEKIRIKEALTTYYQVNVVFKDNTQLSKNKDILGKFVKDQELDDKDAENEFNNAIISLEKVADSYPREKKSGVDVSGTFAEDSLWKAFGLAKQTGKKQATELRMLNKLVENYPESDNIELYRQELKRYYEVDASNSANAIFIDGKPRTLELISIKNPADLSSASFSLAGSSAVFEGGEGNYVSGMKTSRIEKIFVDRIIDDNSVSITGTCINTRNSGTTFTTSSRTLSLNSLAVDLCGEKIRVEDIKLKKAASIRLLPESSGTQVNTNVTIKIGIEKRNIKLSPEKTNEMIKNLNDSIKKWDSLSKNLANVVKGMKAACFATSAVLTAKNFISGFSGESIARQQTMQGENGWTAKCKDMISKGEYVTLTQCYNAKRTDIENEVKARTKAISELNSEIKKIEEPFTTKSDGLGGIIGGSNVNTLEARNKLLDTLRSTYPEDKVFLDSISLSSKDEPSAGTYEQLRDWWQAKKLGSLGDKQKGLIEDQITKDKQAISRYLTDSSSGGLIPFRTNQKATQLTNSKLYDVVKDGSVVKINGIEVDGQTLNNLNIDSAALVEGKLSNDPNSAGNYLVVGKKNGAALIPETKIYKYSTVNGKIKLVEENIGYPAFKQINNIAEIIDSGCGSLKQNKIILGDRKVRFFETGPDKGLPAVVPFDTSNGWYVKVITALNVGNNIGAYDASGLPKNWWICNVGQNGQIDLQTDDCQQMIAGVNSQASLLCLNEQESKRIIAESQEALRQAATQRSSKLITLKISGREEKFALGNPATAYDNVQCQDFMSASDCQILFNVCDPVICPPTRCNFGGQYPVSDVIQTGIVGSALLCLPNYKEGVFVPVCLTGIQAGIDGYVSILKNHRDCLQESLDSGQMVGVCDQIYSVYLCEFFWRQLAPIANILLPKIVEFAYGGGQGARGGGEYMSVMGAWQNTQKSIDYFTQVYAVNSFKSFNIRSVEEVGGEFCKGFVSTKAPSSFKSLIEPDSPSQFHAYFDAIPFTSATVPATSQYKVFYHIYAGKDSGVYYSVYLKNPPESIYYSNSPYITVANGFAPKGQYMSESKDFTAPEGYKELCVRINNEEKCGFKQVSTSFAVNAISDEFAKQELTNNKITSIKECVSGSSSVGSLLQPNIQAGISEAALPQVSNRGIVRICASMNPGTSTEPLRYQEVGYCDDKNMKCWLDKNSVNNAISDNNVGAKNSTLNELKNLQQDQIRQLQEQNGVLSAENVNSALNDRNGFETIISKFESDYKLVTNRDKVKTEKELLNKKFDDTFGVVLEKVLLNHQKAEIALMKARGQAVVADVFIRTSKAAVVMPAVSEVSGDKEVSKVNTLQLVEGTLNSNKVMFVKLNGYQTGVYLFASQVRVKLNSGDSIVAGSYSAGYMPILIELDKFVPESKYLTSGVGKIVIDNDSYTVLEEISNKGYNYDTLNQNGDLTNTGDVIDSNEVLNGAFLDRPYEKNDVNQYELTVLSADGKTTIQKLFLNNNIISIVDKMGTEEVLVARVDGTGLITIDDSQNRLSQEVKDALDKKYFVVGQKIVADSIEGNANTPSTGVESSKTNSLLEVESKLASSKMEFLFEDGTYRSDYYYRYNGGWEWSENSLVNSNWKKVSKDGVSLSNGLHAKDFSEGLDYAVKRTLANAEGGRFANTQLSANRVILNGKDKTYTIEKGEFNDGISKDSIYIDLLFKHDGVKWLWTFKDNSNWYPASQTYSTATSDKTFIIKLQGKSLDLVNSLNNVDSQKGAEYIFAYGL
jgi:hypothetical protein